MAQEIENVDFDRLKIAIKALNESGHGDPIKILGVTKPRLVEQLTDAIESLDEGTELPKETIDWYNWMYADEFEGVEDAEPESEDNEPAEVELSDTEGKKPVEQEEAVTPEPEVEETDSGEDALEQEEDITPEPEEEESEPVVRDPDTGDRLEKNGLVCPECGEDQFDSPSGAVCINDHGGEGITEAEWLENQGDNPEARPDDEPEEPEEPEQVEVSKSESYVFDTAEVLDMLKRAKSGLAKNSHIEDRLRVTLTGTEARSYNGHTCITQPFETDINASIRVDDFIGVLSKVKSKTFAMEPDVIDDVNYVTVSTEDGTSAGFNATSQRSLMENAEDIPMDDLEWKRLPPSFLHGVELVKSSADRKTFGSLSCLCVKKMNVVCSDKIRISIFELEELMDTFLIKAEAADELINFPVTTYCRDKENGWVHFKTDDNTIFSSKIVQAVFVDFYRFLKATDKAPIICEIPKKFKDTVRAAAVMGDHVTITVKDDKISCKSKGNRGWVEKTLPIVHDGEAQIKVDPKLLIKALGKESFFLRELKDKAMVLTTKQFKHLIAVKR